ncbi:3-hydroxyacyl-CoA dehydrogenase, partial|nr:3-hydroxyacyl-CoA dehydrogenase [Escherichia coli]
GTQRLPRLIGPDAAFPMMLTGEPVSAEKAAALGIVDAVVLGDLVAAARTRALEIADSGHLPRVRDRSDKLTPEARERFEALAAEATKRDPDATNVHALARAVRAGLEQDFDAAVAVERAEFGTLVEDPRSKALRYAFFAEREAARVPGLPKDTPRRPIHTAAVIGAGT